MNPNDMQSQFNRAEEEDMGRIVWNARYAREVTLTGDQAECQL